MGLLLFTLLSAVSLAVATRYGGQIKEIRKEKRRAWVAGVHYFLALALICYAFRITIEPFYYQVVAQFTLGTALLLYSTTSYLLEETANQPYARLLHTLFFVFLGCWVIWQSITWLQLGHVPAPI